MPGPERRDEGAHRCRTQAGRLIGINCGEAAGQTVFHAHIHLIPRYWGDDPAPRGGVHAVIPGKKNY
ncbi:MAG: HIT family protein [Betaproteobacteria bacterium]